jgi:uncharacterized membrane protein YkvA (DUF1232 family)
MRYWKMAHDPRTPAVVRGLIYLSIAYTLLPIDKMPKWMPQLGLLDNKALAPGLVTLAMFMIPREVMADEGARSGEAPAPRPSAYVA